jgi:predicted AAA+ superfamily ATPase
MVSDEMCLCLADLTALSVFSNVRTDPVIMSFEALLEGVSAYAGAGVKQGINVHAAGLLSLWSAFTARFIQRGRENAQRAAGRHESFYDYISVLTLTDDNSFTRAAETDAVSWLSADETAAVTLLQSAAANDLDRLGRIAAFDLTRLGFHLAFILREAGFHDAAKGVDAEARAFWAAAGDEAGGGGSAPRSFTFPAGKNWGKELSCFAAHIRAHGAGVLGRHHFFSWDSGLRPVQNPDAIRLQDMRGYEDQRQAVITNTLRFIEGKPASNILLYGDRGTGKSASVKAVCNEYSGKGLRLLEVRKSDLFALPRILDLLGSRGLRFIIFIDDLSFERVDDSFTALKALLEGGVEARPANVVIYATGNRRHFVKEKHSDRPGPAADSEVRAFDTMQEQLSLSDRFGLTVVFTSPSQDEYLAIAEFLAQKRGLLESGLDNGAEHPAKFPAETEALKSFRENALRWEKWFNGRSPRTAVQYVDWFSGGTDFPWL